MSKKITHEQALSGLINAIDHAITKGAFTRDQIVQLNDLIKLFTEPQPQVQQELALAAVEESDNDLPKDPSKP